MSRTRNTAPRGALVTIALVALIAAALLAPARASAETTPRLKSSRADSTRAARPAPTPAPKRGLEVRTLDAINIEGEIAVPQVLFITARDVRRYRDGLGKKFQLSAIEAGRAAVLPSRLRIADTQSP